MIEQEKKFLLPRLPIENLSVDDTMNIKQLYIMFGEDGGHTRIRRVDVAGKQVKYYLAVKSLKVGDKCQEGEIEITKTDFNLLSQNVICGLDKLRFPVVTGTEGDIMIDVYENGLVICEVEWSEGQEFPKDEIPEWLDLSNELPNNSSYSNITLAKQFNRYGNK